MPDQPLLQPVPSPAPDLLHPDGDLFRLLVDSVRDYAIFMLDPTGRVASWNAGAERIKGYTAAEIIGQHFSVFYTRDAIERGWPAAELRQAAANGSIEDEGWRLRKDGSRFCANVVITALYDRSGTLRGFAKVTRDITERQRVLRLEDDARRMHDFIAMLGHELRNPIAPIANAALIAGHAASQPHDREWAVGVIKRQTAQLKRIVDDLLDVSRISRGLIELERQRFDLREALEAARETVAPLVAERGHVLDVHMPAPIVVDADRARLTQVITNLLTNAARYTPPGGRIEVRLESGDTVVRLLVRDTGIGLSAEQIEHIFDLFVQGERGLDRRDGGLGLGLAIARQLAHGHGGTITAQSAGPGQGSTFTLVLPTPIGTGPGA